MQVELDSGEYATLTLSDTGHGIPRSGSPTCAAALVQPFGHEIRSQRQRRGPKAVPVDDDHRVVASS